MKIISALAAVALPFCSSLSIVAQVQDQPSLSDLAGVLTTDAYKPVLDFLIACNPCTVFAPDNDAFAAIGPLPDDVSAVTNVLQYHVLNGTKAASTDLPEGVLSVMMGNGNYLNVVKADSAVTLSFGIPDEASMTATVTTADLTCDNGVVHIINKVMLSQKPSEVATAADLTELIDAVTTAKLVDAVNANGKTIFAPTNAALTAANWKDLDDTTLATVLKAHVIGSDIIMASMINSGVTTVTTLDGYNVTVINNARGISINGAPVVVADAITSAGVVHVIDGVILPTWIPKILEQAQIAGLTSLADIIVNNLDYADIRITLGGDGPFTVFAPTNDAFAAAGLDPAQVAAVKKALKYHVLQGKVMSTDLAEGYNFPATVEGQELSVYRQGTTVKINMGVTTIEATVVQADVECSNGVVHVIDKVLMAPGAVSATAVASGVLDELVKALTKAELVATVDGLETTTIFAPVDKALTDVKWETLDVPTLTSVLKYHVVSGAVKKSTDLEVGDVVFGTVNGENITVTKAADGTVTVNGANVVVANVLTSSGVVHVIDGVLMPDPTPDPTEPTPEPTKAPAQPTAAESSAMRAVPFVAVTLALIFA